MSDATTAPTATGSLAKTPFAHLVLYLYQRRASGTLVLRAVVDHALEEARVLFHRGRAVAAHVASPGLALDQALMPLSAATEGDFEFHESDLVGSGASVITGMFDPFAFVAEAARQHVRADVAAEVLSKYSGVPLLFQPGMDLTRLSLTPDETHFAEAFTRGPVSMEKLWTQSTLPLPAARRLVYVLLITKTIGPQVAQPAQQDASQPPARRSAQPASRPSLPAAQSQPGRRASEQSVRPVRPTSEPITRPLGPGSEPAGRRLSGDPASRSLRPGSDPSQRSVNPSGDPASRSLRPGSDPNQRSVRPSDPGAENAGGRNSGQAWRAIASRAAEMASNRQSPRPPSPLPSAAPPSGRAVSRPLSPMPSERPASRSVRRPGSQPLTSGGSDTSFRPDSRPLSPMPYDATPGSSSQSFPAAGRLTPRPSMTDIDTLDAAGKLRRIEQLCQRNAYDDALPIMRVLIEEDRKSPKYLGLLAHVLLGRTTDGNIGKEIVESVNLALRINPDEFYALYTKARCYKRMGKEREALHYFRRTIAVDPNHLDATREVRLLVLRLSEKRKR